MSRASLQLIADERDGRTVLLCCAVGLWSAARKKGSWVQGGDEAGILSTLGVARTLLVPAPATGRIESDPPALLHTPVSFGEVLYVLDPTHAEAAPTAAPAANGTARELVLRAPYAGRFWQRPATGSLPFVEVDARVEAGATVGLLEVMKTFTHLSYPSDGSLPSPATVARILVEDGAEVAQGDPILQIRP